MGWLRYKALSASGLKKIVDRIVKDAIDYKGQILWVISSCEISKKAHDSFEQYAIEKGFKKAYYKGRGILDSEKVQKWVAKRGILILAILYIIDNQVRYFAKTVHFSTGR